MSEPQKVYIVDDDPSVRDALELVFRLEGYESRGFGSGSDFLRIAKSDPPHCVLLDVHMPGKSGLDVLSELNAQDYPAPIFIISGQGDIPMAVGAVKQGAFDFIEKPFDADTVVERVAEAIVRYAERSGDADPASMISAEAAELLTPREREVLVEITGGASNKEAGRTLGISPRTIEVHRARIMEKLGAKNAADLVRIALGNKR
ncbi:response regulator transcription factor [Lutibaculum baratangense]|uniref:Transcriptional regulatory protein n=1 Tax=Lutibaculum baratangense AMV1 TaxID=631454 RepID=V4RK66_9HYPH|nr:response regulator [Lutibaculum baratangense]ESR26431.1 Transcriptional regulatory protein [Lutibaculum baratangense AMV1]